MPDRARLPLRSPIRPARAVLPCALLLLAGACKSSGVDVEETESVEIGAEGGTFTSPDGSVTLVVPPGALDSEVQITATQVTVASSLGVVAGSAWELGPAGTRFTEPAELTIAYDPAAFSGDAADLRIVEVLEAAGELEVAEHVEHDAAAGTVTGRVHHFSPKAVAPCGNCFPPEFEAEYLGESEGVELRWETPVWTWIQIYRAVLRQCEPGETSGQHGPYTCVSTPAEALLPPPECVAPELAPDGTPCRYEELARAPSAWLQIRDRSLGSRGAVFWYQARAGRDEDPHRSWSWPPRQVTYFGVGDPPETPASFAAAAVADSTIRVTWQATPTATEYELGALVGGTWSDVTLPFTDFSYTYERLEPGTLYQYRIRSVNEHGASAYAFASATPDDVVPPGCEDFRLRLDFDPVPVARGSSDVLPVWVDREQGFTEFVELMVAAGPDGTQAHEVLTARDFEPSRVDETAAYSLLSFTVATDLVVGEEYELRIVGGSPFLETDPEWCAVPVTFEIVQ